MGTTTYTTAQRANHRVIVADQVTDANNVDELLVTNTASITWDTTSVPTLKATAVPSGMTRVTTTVSIASNQNDWAPSTIATTDTIVVTPTGASRTITGIDSTNCVNGKRLLIFNPIDSGGTNAVLLSGESASSSAANRFYRSWNWTIDPGCGVELEYNTGVSRWMVMATIGSLTTTADTVLVCNGTQHVWQQVNTNQIAADAVTYAKIQNVSAASKLLGRGSAAGAGDPEEITLGTGLSMSSTTLNASDGWTYVKLGSDFTNSTTSNNAVTGLKFTPSASLIYEVEGVFLLQSTSTAVGARPGISWPTGLTDQVAEMRAHRASSANPDYRQWDGTTTQNAPTGAMQTANVSQFAALKALVLVGGSPSGDFQITLASQTGGTTVTMKANSFIKYRTI